MTLQIGQKGILKGEVLTIVSINDVIFKCDNGKSYMIKNAFWMTNPNQEEVKTKRAERIINLTKEDEQHLNSLRNSGELDRIFEKSTKNYRNGKSGMSSLEK